MEQSPPGTVPDQFTGHIWLVVVIAVSEHPDRVDLAVAIARDASGLSEGADVFELAESVADLRLRNNTFPGEMFMGLAADALEPADARRDNPVGYGGLRERFLPECEFRGRENRKVQYALLTGAAVRGGLEPDLSMR